MKQPMTIALLLVLCGINTSIVMADTSGALPNTPDSVKQIPAAGAADNHTNGVPTLNVEFQTSHAEIPGSYSKDLKSFAKYLKDNPGNLAEIRGYADESGHGPANGVLAQKRADAVKNYLVTTCGVDASRITAEGYGEVSTKTRNSTEAGKQTNRVAIGTVIDKKS